MATANPYAAWGKANAPGSYAAGSSANPYEDWGTQQSQKIAATKAALPKAPAAAPKQAAKAQKPKKPPRDPNTIGDVGTLKQALSDGSINQDQFAQRFSVLTNSPTKPSLHTGLNAKTAAETAEQTGISLAQFFPRATTELALSLQPTSNAVAPARPNNAAPSLSITKMAPPKPSTPTPTRAAGVTPNNVLTHALFGQAPVTSIQAQSKGAETSHPGGFHVKGTPITLTPRETGAAEAVGKTASDLLAFKGGIESPGRAAGRVRGKIDNVKTSVNNAKTAVHLQTLDHLPRETQPVAPTVPHETAPRPIEEPTAPGAETPQTAPGHAATFKDNFNQLKTIMVNHDIYLEDIEHDMGRKIDENNPQDVQAALNHVKNTLASAGRPVEEPVASAPHQENPQEPVAPPPEAPKPPEAPAPAPPKEPVAATPKPTPAPAPEVKTQKYQTIHEGGKLKSVQGEPVKIVDGVDTFVHKDENGNWAVSEATTGRDLTGGGYPTRHHALTAAKANINQVGVDKFKKLISDHKLAEKPTGGGNNSSAIPQPPKTTTYFRGGGEGAMPKDGTASDVIDYETKELGNNIKVEPGVNLADVQAKHLKWVTDTAEQAKEYGLPRAEAVGNHRVIATDPDGGKLIEVKPERNTESGFAAPGQMADDIKALLERSKHTTALSKDVSDNLFKLRQEQKADIDLATKVLKSNDVSEKDWAAVYHYAEDKSSPVTAAQKKLYDEVIRPLQDASAKDEVPGDYMHRINIDKRGFVQGILKGDFTGIRKSLLRRTADSAKKRTMKAIVDENGDRTVVSIKTPTNRLGKAMGGKRVTGFRGGNATDLGLLKRPTLHKVMEFYDPALMDGLDKIAADLGITHERLVKIPHARKGTAGVSYTGKDLIRTKAASGEEVLLHELGHQIDDRYGLKEVFNTRGRNPEGSAEVAEKAQEMRALADLRFEDGKAGKTPGYTSYVRSGSEKIANMFAAYLHAPEVFKEIAPNTYKDFVDFVGSKPELKPILDLKPTMVLGAREIGEDSLEPNMFVSKAGKAYRIEQATTKEIEGNTPVKYSHHALLNTLTDFVQSRSAARASQFIDQWKQDPSFSEIAKKVDASNIPEHYIPTTAAQFRGYVFEPKVAHYLDDFAGAYQKDPLDAITNLNRFLTTTIFVNPLVHIPNEFASAFINRGVSRYANPASYARLVRTGGKAITEVIKQGKLYDDMQRAGMPSMAYGTEEFNHAVGKLMRKQLQNPYWDERLLAAGIRSPKTLAESFMHGAHKFTWVTQDVLNMQAVLEREAEGMSRPQAIEAAFTSGKGAMPDYRMPTTVAGSRKLQGALKNPNLNVFGNYHLGIIKSYMNIMKELISKDATIKDRGAALDKAAAMGVLAFVVYPQLDHLARAVFGNADAKVRRSGALTIPQAMWDAVHGRKGIGDVVRDVITPPPGTTTAVQLATNKDAFGNEIYDPKELVTNPKQAAKDIGNYGATNAISPIGQASRATRTPMKVLASLFGVSEPKSDLENKVNSLLDSQFGSSMTVQQKRVAVMKSAARNQIAAGNGDSKARALVAMGVITQDNLADFKASAKQTPLQRGFDNLSLTNKEAALESAKPADYAKLGDMQALQVAASHYLHTSTAKPASVAAAKAIIKRFGGDPDKLYATYKAQQKTKREASAARKKAAAH